MTAETAIQFHAKRLVLTRIGSIFMPIKKGSFVPHGNTKAMSEEELSDEVSENFHRFISEVLLLFLS